MFLPKLTDMKVYKITIFRIVLTAGHCHAEERTERPRMYAFSGMFNICSHSPEPTRHFRRVVGWAVHPGHKIKVRRQLTFDHTCP